MTFVCRHIVASVDSEKAIGFHWPADQDSQRPDAWCDACERVRVAEGGDWTEKAAQFLQAKILCGGCYDRAKSISLEARPKGSRLHDLTRAFSRLFQ